jgi:hypothetical protein
LWHDHRENSRAPTLEGFIINNDLEIINKPGTIPTFCSPKGSSYIDLTLPNIAKRGRRHKWLDGES